MFKVGDKLLCKKIVKHIHIKETKYYTITKISYDSVLIDDWWFNKNYNFYSFGSYIKKSYYVWDYFYTPQELRKLKLKQLNDESR